MSTKKKFVPLFVVNQRPSVCDLEKNWDVYTNIRCEECKKKYKPDYLPQSLIDTWKEKAELSHAKGRPSPVFTEGYCRECYYSLREELSNKYLMESLLCTCEQLVSKDGKILRCTCEYWKTPLDKSLPSFKEKVERAKTKFYFHTFY